MKSVDQLIQRLKSQHIFYFTEWETIFLPNGIMVNMTTGECRSTIKQYNIDKLYKEETNE